MRIATGMRLLIGAAMLAAGELSAAAMPACFTTAPDSSGVGDLHLLSADPLSVGNIGTMHIVRASAFFRDRDLTSISVELTAPGSQTLMSFTFVDAANYEIVSNLTAHVGSDTSNPATRAYLVRHRYCVRVGQLLTSPQSDEAELKAARDALEVLRKLLALNRTLPEVKVAVIGPPRARGG
jgi:Spy/CpxP family protein refolding chaperone